MASMFDTYAAKLCRQLKLAPATYDIPDLNGAIMALPLAEAHAALKGVALENLPRLGETVSLNEHMQAHFFGTLLDEARVLPELTQPVLIKRPHLERLEGWRDWRTLTVYLANERLEPVVVFRNTPVPLKAGAFETMDYYVADIRVVLAREAPFEWRGHAEAT